MAKYKTETTPRFRVFSFLAQALAEGIYRPGEFIRIAEVARDLGLSGTPVREALCRLAGARLVEDRQREGFCLVRLTRDEVAAAYDLEAHVYNRIIDGLEGEQLPDVPTSPGQDSTGVGPPIAFQILQQMTANALLRAQAIDLGARLAPYRRHETDVIADARADTLRLDQAVTIGDWQGVRIALKQYVDRRVAAAHRLQDAGSR
ncbi:GntR family transcriptional regulator [Glacieibacterium megasporae]|uniref:GntR family transcriptional regulator n=1 Tax=Glacieibacterium megasporae TaxID=2835787 RepID=UPI001C1E80D9|nr:GntR family transcriptional regulator [Polymorphobacter megasporae]UAJ12372.1 GntR family transcriptional regulator [Polymorphobacter megasporae]